MSVIQIEAGIPIPPHGNRGNVKGRLNVVLPFDGMRVGDSFLAPEGIGRIYVVSAAAKDSKASRRGYATRVMDDGRVRCWRVA